MSCGRSPLVVPVDVVVDALAPAVPVLAAAEVVAGADVLLLGVLVTPVFALLPAAAAATVTVLSGASVLLAAELVAAVDAGVVVLLADAAELALLGAALLWLSLSRPTRVCNRLANRAARPAPMPSLPLLPSED